VILTPHQLEAALRDIGARRYHNLHPFHRLLHGGKLTKGQVQAWALNRYYYQAMIPVKDAALIARCDDPAVRREWRSRLVDHDGESENDGGVARWLALTDALGLDRAYVTSLRGLLPATRFAVDAYVNFVRERSLLEAIASSLTELFSPAIISERVSGMLANYDFVTPETLAYFSKRPPQAERDSDFALAYVKEHATSAERQHAVLAALEFKCDVLWSMLDALYHAYVEPKHVPPGCFMPDEQKPSPQPRFPRGVRLVHSEAHGGWVLLAPERMFKADAISAEILKRCTGEVTLDAIVDDLAKTYNAPRDRISGDVTKLLGDLASKKLVEL
jgi:coenzyme PQQ biosynthesis protein C/coenzyme PQQ biosynthesis protein PqqD